MRKVFCDRCRGETEFPVTVDFQGLRRTDNGQLAAQVRQELCQECGRAVLTFGKSALGASE